MPCYEGLVAAGPGGAPLWLADAVLATRVQFLMAVLAPCVPRLPQVGPAPACRPRCACLGALAPPTRHSPFTLTLINLSLCPPRPVSTCPPAGRCTGVRAAGAPPGGTPSPGAVPGPRGCPCGRACRPIPGVARQAKLTEVALPLALLYAAHAHAAVALAAHGLFCAVLRAADEVRRPRRPAPRRARADKPVNAFEQAPCAGGGGEPPSMRRARLLLAPHKGAAHASGVDLFPTVAGLRTRRPSAAAHAPPSCMQPRTLRVSAAPTPAGRALQKEPLAPYYASRALAAYPARTPLAGLTAGYAELARTLPVGSAAASLALRRLAARAGELLVGGRAGAGLPASLPNPSREPAARAVHELGAPGHGGAQGGGQGGSALAAGPGRAQGMEQAEVAAGLGLVRLLAQLLLLVDLQVSPRMPAGAPPIPRPPVLGV